MSITPLDPPPTSSALAQHGGTPSQPWARWLQKLQSIVTGVQNISSASCAYGPGTNQWSTTSPPAVYKCGQAVQLQGIARINATITRYSTVLLTIPKGYWPNVSTDVLCATSGGLNFANLFIDTQGNITWSDVGTLPTVGDWLKFCAVYLSP